MQAIVTLQLPSSNSLRIDSSTSDIQGKNCKCAHGNNQGRDRPSSTPDIPTGVRMDII